MRGRLGLGLLFIAALLAAPAGCRGSSAKAPAPPRPRPLPTVAAPTGPRPDTIVLAIGTTRNGPPGPTVQVVEMRTNGTGRRVLLDTNGALALGGSEPWALLSPDGAGKMAYVEHLYRRNRQRVFIEDLASLRKTPRFYGLPGSLLWDGVDVVFVAAPPPYRGISHRTSPRELPLTRLGPGSESSVTTYTVAAGTHDIAGAMMPLGSDAKGIYFVEMRFAPMGSATVGGMWRARRSDHVLELLREWPEAAFASPAWPYLGVIDEMTDPTKTGIWATISHLPAGLRDRSKAIEQLPSTVTLYRLADMSLLATYAVPTFMPDSAKDAPGARFGPPAIASTGLKYLQLRPDPSSASGESAMWEVEAGSGMAVRVVPAPSLGRIDQVAYADEFGDVIYTVFNPGRTSAVKTVRFLDRATGRTSDLARLVSTSAVQHELLKVIGTYSSKHGS